VHESVVVSPARNPVQPGLKQAKLHVTEFLSQSFQKENGKDFFFQNLPNEKFLCDLHKEVDPELLSNLPPEADS
jgi:hypothetical protein